MTKSQRRKHYIRAAELIDSDKIWYCCTALKYSLDGQPEFDLDLEFFPEFKDMKPDRHSNYGNWFGFACDFMVPENVYCISKKKQNSRIFALLFCAEMCK